MYSKELVYNNLASIT